MKKESRLKSIIKAVTWRIIATGTTFLLAYFVFSSGDCTDVIEKSSLVAGLELIIKLVFYYLHERIWQRVKNGVFQTIPDSK